MFPDSETRRNRTQKPARVTDATSSSSSSRTETSAAGRSDVAKRPESRSPVAGLLQSAKTNDKKRGPTTTAVAGSRIGLRYGVVVDDGLYKTELCRSFEEEGQCRYGAKCRFAHGVLQLRRIARHPRYKTELCQTFHSRGFCPYGLRCHFVHNEPNCRLEQLTASDVLSVAVAVWFHLLAAEAAGRSSAADGTLRPTATALQRSNPAVHRPSTLIDDGEFRGRLMSFDSDGSTGDGRERYSVSPVQSRSATSNCSSSGLERRRLVDVDDSELRSLIVAAANMRL